MATANIRFVRSIYVMLMISFCSIAAIAQTLPDPCGPTPIMYNNCADACVICDIDGFTGTNNLQAGYQGPIPGNNIFCSFPNDLHFIAFIAGSTSLSVQISVSNCSTVNGESSLDLGFYESLDCQSYTPITTCYDDLADGQSFVFNTTQPLVVGQHYYIIMDGSSGAICDWTFDVLQGSTQVDEIDVSGDITGPSITCPNVPTFFEVTQELGAAFWSWRIDGTPQPGIDRTNALTFPADGTYEVCVTASNPCDDAEPSCTMIDVRTVGSTSLVEDVCDGDCYTINGVDYCTTGTHQEIIEVMPGCDSIIILDLTVLPQAQESVDVWICNDDFFFIGATPYNMTGMYEQTIQTAMDCDSIVFLDLLVIECEIIGTPEEIPVICNGTATGTLIFSVDQGEPPLTYTYTSLIDPTLTGTGMTNLLINNEIPGIPAGSYQIYIQDNFGNDVVVLQDVTEPPVLELTLIPSDYNGFNVSCFSDESLLDLDNNGTLIANVIGGVPPYEYLWSDMQITQEAINLSAIEYSVTVTDAVGCQIDLSYTMTAPTAVVPIVEFNDPTCDGFNTGSIAVTGVSGGIPGYEYDLDGMQFQSDTIFMDLFEDLYTVFVQDANGCVVSVDGQLTAPDIPVIDLGPDLTIILGDSIQLSANLNNTSIQTIDWQNPLNVSCNDCLDPYVRPFNDETFTLMLTSEDDCTDIDTINIRVDKRRRVYIPNAFSPNGDGINDDLIIHTGIEADLIENFNVYDRWGNLIFEKKNFPPNELSEAWNGRFKSQRLNPGVYVWYANVHFLDDISLSYQGDISLVR